MLWIKEPMLKRMKESMWKVDETGELTLAQAYQPYGETLSSVAAVPTSRYASVSRWL